MSEELTLEDLENGLKAMMDNEEISKRKNKSSFDIISHLYN